MPIELPGKVSESGLKSDHARAINKLIEAVRRVQLVAGPGQSIEQTANGTTIKMKQSLQMIVGAKSDDFFY